MTLQEYREQTSWKEQEIFATQLQAWLRPYTQEVYVRVMKQMEDIINSEIAPGLIKELYEREQKENNDEMLQIMCSIGKEDVGLLHLHPLEHSGSYRDILYDLYIRK